MVTVEKGPTPEKVPTNQTSLLRAITQRVQPEPSAWTILGSGIEWPCGLKELISSSSLICLSCKVGIMILSLQKGGFQVMDTTNVSRGLASRTCSISAGVTGRMSAVDDVTLPWSRPGS